MVQLLSFAADAMLLVRERKDYNILSPGLHLPEETERLQFHLLFPSTFATQSQDTGLSEMIALFQLG